MTPALLGLVGLASAVALPASSTATAPIEAVETGNSSPDITPDIKEIPTKFTDVREKIVKEYKNVNEIPTAKYFSEYLNEHPPAPPHLGRGRAADPQHSRVNFMD